MTHGDDNGLRHAAAARADRARDRADLQDRRRARARARSGRPASQTSLGDVGASRSRRVCACTSTTRDGMKPGAKYYEWELRGIPLRMELGPRDLDKQPGRARASRHAREAPGLARRRSARTWPTLLSTRSSDDMLAAARERREANSVRAAHLVRRLPGADGRQGRVRLRRLVRRRRRARRRSRRRRRRRFAVFPTRSSGRPRRRRPASSAASVAATRRGAVGEGVLTTGFSRVDGALALRGRVRSSASRATSARRSTSTARRRCATGTSGSTTRSRRCRIAFTTRSRRTRSRGVLERAARARRRRRRRVRRRAVSRARGRLRAATTSSSAASARRSASSREALDAGVLLVNVESRSRGSRSLDRLAGERGVDGARVACASIRRSRSTRRTTTSRPASKGHKFGIPYDDVRATSRESRRRCRTSTLHRARHAHRLAARRASIRIATAPSGSRRSARREFEKRRHRHARVSRHRRRAWRVATTTRSRPISTASRSARAADGRRPGSTLIMEPGRFIVGNAGVLLAGAVSQAQRRARTTSSPTPA